MADVDPQIDTPRRSPRDWTELSTSPVAPEVHRFLLETCAAARHCEVAHYPDFLRSQVAGRSVLDIGIVEHDESHMRRPGWVHDVIRAAAAQTFGIDVLEDPISILRERGYDVAVADATSEVDLGRRFEVVHIGDVVEHVDNPTALLRFAARHLTPRGKIIVRTPNPYWFRYILRGAREGTMVANAEHLAWVTPSMAIELGRRARLELESYWLIRGPSNSIVGRVLQRWMVRKELFVPNFTYVFTAPDAASP